MRCTLLLFLMIWMSPAAWTQDWAKERLEKSPRHLEWVDVRRGDRTIRCFLAFPEVKEKATAVVVIHEIFGLTDWVRGVTDQLAEAGYIAIAPDLLSGTGPGGGGTAELGGDDAARKAISALPPDQVTADLKAVADHVAGLPASNGKVAVAGFCWGGTQTFRFATNSGKPRAFFAFYGSAPEKTEELARIPAPVYGFYGENDARVNATLPRTKELMAQLKKAYEAVTYPGAGHGFMRAGEGPDASPADREAREKAWARWKSLLGTVDGRR